MEVILTLVIAFSVITNLLVVKTLKQFNRPVELSPILETTGCSCGEGLAAELKGLLLPLLEEDPVKVPAPPDESHYAWKNRVEEPTAAPPTPHGPPPKLEPLARPYGFSR